MTTNVQLKELRRSSGLSQRKFAETYDIPRRTLEDWEAGKRTLPEARLQEIKAVIKGKRKKLPQQEWIAFYWNVHGFFHSFGVKPDEIKWEPPFTGEAFTVWRQMI